MNTRVMITSGMLVAVAAILLVSCPPELESSISVDGITRTYQLYLPPQRAEKLIPLVIALHPLFFDSSQMRQMSRFDSIGAREGFAVVYPDGLERGWDVLIGGKRDVRFMEVLMDHLIQNHRIDPARIYATGASNGGMLCHQLACCLPGRIAAIAPVMGTPPQYVLDAGEKVKPIPVLIIHGTDDQILPYEGDLWRFAVVSAPASAEFWAAQNGCHDTYWTTSLPDIEPSDGTTVDLIDYACGDRPMVRLCRVNGGGHNWPGDLQYLTQWTFGRVSLEFDASEMIWQFFSTQTARRR